MAAAEPAPVPGVNVPMLPPEALDEAEKTVAEVVSAPAAEVVEVVPLASIDLGDVARSVVTTPFVGFIPPRSSPAAGPVADPAAGPAADLPIIPFKPLDPQDEEARLEELDLVEQPANPPSPAPALEALEPVARKCHRVTCGADRRHEEAAGVAESKDLMGVALGRMAVLGRRCLAGQPGLRSGRPPPASSAPVARPAVETLLPLPELQAAPTSFTWPPRLSSCHICAARWTRGPA